MSDDFKPKYKLVDKSDPILNTKIERFDFDNPPIDPNEFAVDLAEHMMYYNGMGLAANQLGLKYRVFAVLANPILVCYNPIIVDTTSEEIYLEEGCLTFPNLFLKIKRPKSIKIRYTEPNGETFTKMFTGMTARIMQHETDHLNGILYTSLATSYHLELGKKKVNK